MSRLHNPFVAACIVLLVFLPTFGILVSLLTRRRDRRIFDRQRQLQRIIGPAQSYRPIDHVHEIDFHRSGVTVTDAGAIFARCCIVGCEEGVFIGQNMAAAWKVTPAEASMLPSRRTLWI